MVRFVRLCAAAALATALAAASAANAQTGPLEEGPLETGPLQTPPSQATPQKAKLRRTALQKRAAKKAEPAGRQITVHARPSYLTAGTAVPVGSYNGYVYDTFNQPSPIEGTFSGMRGRERLTDQFGNAAPGLTLFKF
jgi:hypothetical protein